MPTTQQNSDMAILAYPSRYITPEDAERQSLEFGVALADAIENERYLWFRDAIENVGAVTAAVDDAAAAHGTQLL